MTLLRLASDHQERLIGVSDRAARQVLGLWQQISAGSLEPGWSAVAPQVERVVTNAQVDAAGLSSAYVSSALRGQGIEATEARIVPEAFGGVTREGRAVAPELYAAVTTTKTLIGRGVGVGQAFRAGAAFMSVMASTLVRDAGRSADRTLAVGKGTLRSVRVLSPGACSRCAILAGVVGYRADFKRHPGCKCSSMPIRDGEGAPEGFFNSPDEYFDSLSKAEQERVFTKAGAEAIRAGADPMKVVNARRGAYGVSYSARGTGRVNPGRLQPVTIGTRADGSPLQVYATREGTTSRGAFAQGRTLNANVAEGDRYRRTPSLRLMPESIFQMSSDPARIRELLQKYGYIS